MGGQIKYLGFYPICVEKVSNPKPILKSPEHLHLKEMVFSASMVALNMVTCQRTCQCPVNTWGFKLNLFPYFSVCPPCTHSKTKKIYT